MFSVSLMAFLHECGFGGSRRAAAGSSLLTAGGYVKNAGSNPQPPAVDGSPITSWWRATRGHAGRMRPCAVHDTQSASLFVTRGCAVVYFGLFDCWCMAVALLKVRLGILRVEFDRPLARSASGFDVHSQRSKACCQRGRRPSAD